MGGAGEGRMDRPGTSGKTPLFEWWTHGESVDVLVKTEGEWAGEVGPEARSETWVPVDEELWRYRHEAATVEAAKQSVTALRKRASEAEDESAQPFRGADGNFRIRRDTDGAAILDFNAAERGTIHHRFLEHVELSRTETRAGLEAELERLRSEGRFEAAEAAVVDLDAMERLWSSDLGRELREAGAEVRREIPFTMRLTPGDLDGLGLPHAAGLDAEEYVVVQGVIDIAVWRADGTCWIGDFKTDQVDEAGLAAKARTYGPQLALYALALKRIYGRVATRRWLYFLSLGRSCDV
jgi:ATP-dependent helicase/nuclease subunit A